MEQLSSVQIKERGVAITNLIAQWREDGSKNGIERTTGHNQSPFKEGELQITLSQRQHLRMGHDGYQWQPVAETATIEFNTIAISDPQCSIEGDVYLLKKIFERLDNLLLEKRQEVLEKFLASV